MSPSIRGFLYERLALAGCLTLSSCGGGSGGDGSHGNTAKDAIPFLVRATFVGAGVTPSAGDRLQLFLSEDVSLVAGRLVDDLDFALSNGASLGNVVTAPSLKNARTIELTLGANPSFTPGVSTIDFGSANDGVRDQTGNFATTNIARAIELGDRNDPVVSAITLSAVGSLLNGTGPAGGTLQVPTSGFTIDLDHIDGSSAIDTSHTVIVSSVVVSVNGTNRQAGLDLADAFTRTSTAATSSFLVPATVTLPVGDFEITAYVFDVSGMVSVAATFRGRAQTPLDTLRPFETTVNPTQLWFIDTSRDVESYTINVLNFITPAQVDNRANGRSDLEDLLHAVGLHSTSPIPNVSGSKNSNEVVMDAFKSSVIKHLNTLFLGANITFTFTRPAAWPGGSQIAYHAVAFSQISLAGAEDATGRTGLHGVAIFNPNNTAQEDDTLIAFAGNQRLGVFLHTVINDGLIAHPTTLFRTTFDPFTAARFGTAIGNEGNDGLRLIGTLIDGRTTSIANAVVRFAKFAAVILAHECGHSVGLVANGPMPLGLYGDNATDFPVFPASAADGHIKMPASLFPGISENIMTPAFDFDSALAPETQFNSLNRAYLLERVVVGK
jgi:hypothetical protein